MNDFFQLQLYGAVIHYKETQCQQKPTKSTATGESTSCRNVALATDKNGHRIGLPGQPIAEYAARWDPGTAPEGYTQQGPPISPMKKGLQECKMSSISLSEINHLS